jgi:hypothetical protein
LRRLLRAIGGAREDPRRRGQMVIEPFRHSLGLLDAFRSQAAAEIRLAGFGFRMSPED